MRPDGTWSGISVGVVAAAVALAVPIAAPASTHTLGRAAAQKKPAGLVFGGVTSQGGPVVVELSKSGRQMARAVVGIRLTCTSGASATVFDGYQKLAVKSRRFSTSFGPQVSRNADGTTTDFEGSIAGTINKARSKATGTWQLKATDRDAAGTVTDTCDSGAVSWSAKQ